MSKVFIEETSLTAIGDAIREKTGGSDKMSPAQMVTAIEGIETGGSSGGTEIEPIVLTGAQNYGCAGALGAAFIEMFPDKVSTEAITSASNMFYQSPLKQVPFDINFKSGKTCLVSSMFEGSGVETLPAFNNLAMYDGGGGFIAGANYVREVPDGFDDTWDWSYVQTGIKSVGTGCFSRCSSLRYITPSVLKNMGYCGATAYYSHPYYQMFYYCYHLDAIQNLGVCFGTLTSSNIFNQAFYQCSSLKEFYFEFEDYDLKQPKTANWAGVTIDLSSYVGYFQNTPVNFYNSGRSLDTRVIDAITYQSLKWNPDWWTSDIRFSRYNRDSAILTIQSLPDCSEYQTANSKGTNTIKFKGASGESTDGGAINTMDEAYITLAANKGWTVTFV